MNAVNWSELEENEVIPGLYGKFFHAPNMTIVQWRFEKGTELPVHNHHHEQITMVQKGELELTIDDQSHILKDGDTILISPNLEHGGKAMQNTLAYDIFHPAREDFKEKYG